MTLFIRTSICTTRYTHKTGEFTALISAFKWILTQPLFSTPPPMCCHVYDVYTDSVYAQKRLLYPKQSHDEHCLDPLCQATTRPTPSSRVYCYHLWTKAHTKISSVVALENKRVNQLALRGRQVHFFIGGCFFFASVKTPLYNSSGV